MRHSTAVLLTKSGEGGLERQEGKPSLVYKRRLLVDVEAIAVQNLQLC